MKFTDKKIKKEGSQKERTVYMFTVGKMELLVLAEILADINKRTPRTLFTQPLTGRVDAMMVEIVKLFKEENIKWPLRRQEIELDDGEVF